MFRLSMSRPPCGGQLLNVQHFFYFGLQKRLKKVTCASEILRYSITRLCGNNIISLERKSRPPNRGSGRMMLSPSITASGAPGSRPDLSRDVCVRGVVHAVVVVFFWLLQTAWDPCPTLPGCHDAYDIEAADLPARAVWRFPVQH